MVHRREVNGEPIVLGNHGALWGNAMTWWDHETGSVWSQPIGEAILGPLRGTTLELLPSTLTTWADWQAEHPDTLALDVVDQTRNFELGQTAIVVEFGDDSVAYPVPDIRPEIVVNSAVGGVPIAVVVLPDTDRWAVLSRKLDDEIVELAFAADGTLQRIDGTGRWDPTQGLALDGGPDINVLPGFTSFPADYETFFPDGNVWTPEGLVPVSR